MKLTSAQQQLLKRYLWLHKNPMSESQYWIAMLWRSSYVIYAGVFVVAALIIVTQTSLTGPWVYVVLGIVLGLIIRELWVYRQTIRSWRVLDLIIDWSKVAQLSGEHEDTDSAAMSRPEMDS